MGETISCSISVQGEIFGYPAQLVLGTENNSLLMAGTLKWGEKSPGEVLAKMDETLAGRIGSYLNRLLPSSLPGEAKFLYQRNTAVIKLNTAALLFQLVTGPDGKALLFSFQTKETSGDGEDSILLDALETVADLFGVRTFYFYAQTGASFLFPQMGIGKNLPANLPDVFQNSPFLVYTHLVMEGNSIFVQAMRTLFGLQEAELLTGIGKSGFAGMIAIPAFETSFIKSENLCLMVSFGKGIGFRLAGEFIFSFLPKIVFSVSCGIATDGFQIEAFAKMQEPQKLFGPFGIGDTCLIIEMSTGIGFGLYSTLYIGKLPFFGAVMLKAQGPAVNLELLSAAVIRDLTIPDLLENLLGTHISALDVLDFLKIEGLPFQKMEAFEWKQVEERNLDAIVSCFNAQVKNNPSLRLETAQAQVTPFGDGADLADLKRMRHYYISRAGELKLSAQFYYATVKTSLGNYTIEPGFFICGVLVIFGKRFEVLFSVRESDGILAYAKIPEINLGFLKLGPSTKKDTSAEALPIAENSVLGQFLNPKQEGIVFFLSAGKKDASFYFDGRIVLLELFSVDARIVFCKGLISIDCSMMFLSLLTITLHLKVDYRKFSSAAFEFCLMIDTACLREKLEAVTKKIEAAITRLRNKIDNAQKQIDRAQAHVNELYGQIGSLDKKIQDCKKAISSAKWWKRVFVAIAKGIEIAAYEAAKIGIYAAIGVATAALQAAKGLVALGGLVGEGVLKAVNAVIQGAMSLFFLNYIKLEAKASAAESNFKAEIEFVALGKTYHFKTEVAKKGFEEDPTGSVTAPINKELEPELKDIEAAATKSNWKKHKHETYTAKEHCERLLEAKAQIASSIRMMKAMEQAYVGEFQVSMAEFDEMNASVLDAVSFAHYSMDVGQMGEHYQTMSRAMGGLKRSVRAREKSGAFRADDLKKVKRLLADYDEARTVYHRMADSRQALEKQKALLKEHMDSLKQTTANEGKAVMDQSGGDPVAVLDQIEKKMYTEFPVDRSGKHIINLSREPFIQECFAQADQEMGRTPGTEIRRMRSRSRKGKYERRL